VRYVELEAARQARGLRLVVLAHVPSPWSETAKGLFHVGGVEGLCVRQSLRDQDTRAWTGVHNAPVAMYDDEPPRSHWSDILELAERLGAYPLVPAGAEAEVARFGEEILGEGGLVWSGRMCLLDVSFTSQGARGFSVPVAQYLAAKYGYAAEKVPAARARVVAVLERLGARLANRTYLLGDFTAADIFAATALATFFPLPDEQCPLLPAVRKIFEPAAEQLHGRLPPELERHRALVYERHLGLPVVL
jgi:glutathione S-transferase